MKKAYSPRRVQPRESHGASHRALWALTVSFLLGLGLGLLAAGHVSSQTAQTLSQYLQSYVMLDVTRTQGVVWEALGLYLRYPLLAFALGFVALGVIAIPVLTVAFGFFLSFGLSALVVSFGMDGVWLGLALCGLRCVVTMACYFVLAMTGMEAAVARLQGKTGYDKGAWLRLGICLGGLLLGVYLECVYGATWLGWALAQGIQ